MGRKVPETRRSPHSSSERTSPPQTLTPPGPCQPPATPGKRRRAQGGLPSGRAATLGFLLLGPAQKAFSAVPLARRVLTSLTRGWPRVPCGGGTESQPLDQQGRSWLSFLKPRPERICFQASSSTSEPSLGRSSPRETEAPSPNRGNSPPVKDGRLCKTQKNVAHREENLQSGETHPHPEPTVALESADDATLFHTFRKPTT